MLSPNLRVKSSPHAYGAHVRKAQAFEYAARALMRDCEKRQLPPADLFLRSIKLNEDLARELHPHVYASYQEAYRSQGTQTQRIHSRRALLLCLELLRPKNRTNGQGKRHLIAEVARAAGVSIQLAGDVVNSAVLFRRVMKRVARQMMEPPNDAVVDPIWLREAASGPAG